MKRSRLEQLGEFLLGKGFYIVLILCVAAIGISGYMMVRSAADAGQTDEPVSGQPTIVLPDSSIPLPSGILGTEETPVSGVEDEVELQQAAGEPDLTEGTQAPADTAKEVVYTWPVKGTVLRPFSVETLSYDVTMGDWRTHGGVDIAAELGWNVIAAGEGQVAEVYEDAMMGVTVVVEQPDGVVTTYSNLAPDPAVAVGDQVDTGTIIGQVGESAMAECDLAPHLHLEMAANGEQTDPLLYLPQ